MSAAAQEIKYALTDARRLCEQLGLLADRKGWLRQPRGAIVRCPWHGEKNPSCSVREAQDGTIAAKCFSCGAAGDALSLVAAARGLSLKSEFRSVLIASAELAGLFSLVAELESGQKTIRPEYVPPPRPIAQPERTYPDTVEVEKLIADASPCMTDPAVAGWLVRRNLDPYLAANLGMVALREGRLLPRFGAYKGRSWWETGHRAILPVYDATGERRSIRAIRVLDDDSPKRLPPAGHKASGLVLACEMGVAMLRGTFPVSELVIAEGEPDFLVLATRSRAKPTAHLGVLSGSWSEAFAERVPIGCEVDICTHVDRAGEAYAEEIKRTLRRRGCVVNRWKGNRR